MTELKAKHTIRTAALESERDTAIRARDNAIREARVTMTESEGKHTMRTAALESERDNVIREVRVMEFILFLTLHDPHPIRNLS